MKIRSRAYTSDTYSIKESFGGFLLITRLKPPEIQVLYDLQSGNHIVHYQPPETPQQKIDDAVKKAIVFVKHNIVK